MEFFNYDRMDKEYDRILEEAEPCPECGEVETLALVVVTSKENFGSLLIFCADCHIDNEDEFSIKRKEETVYA